MTRYGHPSKLPVNGVLDPSEGGAGTPTSVDARNFVRAEPARSASPSAPFDHQALVTTAVRSAFTNDVTLLTPLRHPTGRLTSLAGEQIQQRPCRVTEPESCKEHLTSGEEPE